MTMTKKKFSPEKIGIFTTNLMAMTEKKGPRLRIWHFLLEIAYSVSYSLLIIRIDQSKCPVWEPLLLK